MKTFNQLLEPNQRPKTHLATGAGSTDAADLALALALETLILPTLSALAAFAAAAFSSVRLQWTSDPLVTVHRIECDIRMTPKVLILRRVGRFRDILIVRQESASISRLSTAIQFERL